MLIVAEVSATGGGVVAVGRTVRGEGGQALRVSGASVTSLDFPATAEGTEYSPWKVSASGREVAVSGTLRYPRQRFPQPMLLTTRL